MVKAISNPFINVVKVVTGQRIVRARVNYPRRRRAEDAALWLRGQLAVEPTAKLAAAVFGVTVPLVIEARKRQELLGDFGSVSSLSDDLVERIVAEVGVERVWRALDRYTQPPQLRLVAAE